VNLPVAETLVNLSVKRLPAASLIGSSGGDGSDFVDGERSAIAAAKP
jgi:hypothetical protein